LYIWQIPATGMPFWKHLLGGWSLAGITTFQSGGPFTVRNGSDRNGDIWNSDRPDIGNPGVPLNTRADLSPTCASGYLDPDSRTCVTPSMVHWIEGRGFPDASTVGRNTLHSGGTNNFDLTLLRTFHLGDRARLEFRWEAQNAFNHPQYVNLPGRD